MNLTFVLYYVYKPYYFEFMMHIFCVFSRWKLFKNLMNFKFEDVLYSK
jgi:hypothetical protein